MSEADILSLAAAFVREVAGERAGIRRARSYSLCPARRSTASIMISPPRSLSPVSQGFHG
ncbi:hypothetical protein WBP07_20180 (plasmid) [Novosphingobium sp. BL-8A]|uniref:hypothetical protein n=1 Tax=Novosphingobium sp. BL-8A TaxID=3127639 RepID=UPI00375718F4